MISIFQKGKGGAGHGAAMGSAQREAKPSTFTRKQHRSRKENAKAHDAKLKQLLKNAGPHDARPRDTFKRATSPKSAQDVISYWRMVEDGICEIEPGLFSRTIRFSDINYQTARRDDQIDIFSRYCEFLNWLSSSIHLQINLINRRIDKDSFKEQMFLKYQGERLDEYRKEINTMLSEKALEGQNSILREKYMTVTTAASSYETSIPALARLETDILGHLKSLGCDAGTLSGAERLELLHETFRPDDRFTFSYSDLLGSGLTTKSFIAPSYFEFPDNKPYFQFGDYYGQVVFLRDYPTEQSDQFVTKLTDLPIDMNVSVHITNVDQGQALEYVRRQIAFMEMEATEKQSAANQGGRNPELALPMETRRSYEEAVKLLAQLEEQNQKMFKVNVLVFTYAEDLDTLQDNISQIMAVAREQNMKFDVLRMEQRKALNSVLPLGKNWLSIERTLTTSSTAIFVPFTTQELYQPGGIYYGLNAMSHNLIFFNRLSMDVGSGMILGTPGSGKSMGAKGEISNVLLRDPNSEVIVLDPEREYAPLADGFDGEVIRIGGGSKSCINPMDINLNYSEDANPISLKSDFILGLCELIVGGRNGLMPIEKTVIDRAVRMVYRRYLADPRPENMPVLGDLYNALRSQREAEAQNIATALEIYVSGSLSVFNGQTNVDITNRLVCYDIKALGKQLKQLGMHIVQDQIWGRVTANRSAGKATWCYLDEFHLLLKEEQTAAYSVEIWKRFRKWGGVPTGITQNVKDLLSSREVENIFENSDFIYMLNQAAGDREILASRLGISPHQLSYVTHSGEGEGLLFYGNVILPFVDHFPRDTELYRLLTTKPDEVRKEAKA